MYASNMIMCWTVEMTSAAQDSKLAQFLQELLRTNGPSSKCPPPLIQICKMHFVLPFSNIFIVSTSSGGSILTSIHIRIGNYPLRFREQR